ncbi:MAG TPA: hypothetical protein VGN83_19095 [Falsiroseomonas sp.]|jgi:hypothetical protein|nr:hypothetical protein [Falsiroseomonas sp.]
MKKNLIVPALLAMGFASGTLPAPALAQDRSQDQSGGGSPGMGSQASGSAYERYLRQMHEELMRENASRQGSGGGSQSQGQSQGQSRNQAQAQDRQADWQQFMRGYRAGREEERRRREARSGQGQGGNQGQGPAGQSSSGQDSSNQSSSGQDSRQASGQDRDRMYVIPNVYPDSARFQQFAVVPDYSRTMDHLLIAAQSLREAIQDLAQQPAGERRNQAISQMQDALVETQQAMMRIPPDMR